tara:strand:- start:774 stop:1556 length:783 start_codon:yes stop_codon:yes gene_type:complete
MGIFRNITRNLKKAAPLIGSAIGMYIGGPAGMAALGGALGGGIGSLVGGGDTEDALIAAGLGGLGGYMAQGSFNTANAVPPGRQVVGSKVSDPSMSRADLIKSVTQDSRTFSSPSFFSKLIPESTLGKVALGGGIGALALGGLGDEEEKKTETSMRPYPTGKPRLGTGIVDGMEFNLNNEEERKEYFRRVREKQGIGRMMAANGGEVNGPGTGTSDSVPARLSDGEFVLTAKAVRGAGGGDRDLGAARMYDMMSELERVA